MQPESSGSTGTKRGRRPGVLSCVAILLFGAGATLAAGPPQPFERDRMLAAVRMLSQDRVVDRMSLQLESLSSPHPVGTIDRFAARHVLQAELVDSVERTLERATRRALRDFVLDRTGLEQRLERIQDRRSARAAGDRDAAGVRFGVGISHLEPRLVMDFETQRGSLRLSAGASGDLGLRYGSERLGRARLRAGLVGGDELYLNCSFDF